MWNISYDLNKLTLSEKGGYEFIKSIKLYIPYKEIGLNVLVRKEQPLPFFYEIILKLINCKCSDIANISKLTGVEEDILNDVVGEMSRLDLVYIKSNTLILTPKGNLALSELKKTIIEKEDINKIYINAITGKIEEVEQPYRRPTKNNPCLHEIIQIDDRYIADSFSNFNEYYQKLQEEIESETSNIGIKNEIYQIINKKYDKLCYSEKKAFIFKNVRDGDLMYECESDLENVYSPIFAKQINHFPGTRKFLKRHSDVSKYLDDKMIKDNEKESNTNALIKMIKAREVSYEKCTESIEKCYFTDRYLLENEYIHILSSIKNIKPSEIIISSGNLYGVLNYDSITALQGSLDYSKVKIISDVNEWNIKKLKSNVLNYKQNKKNKIDWIEIKNIKHTDIVLYPQCAITIRYVPISVGNDYLIQEIADITFDNKKIKEKIDNLLNVE